MEMATHTNSVNAQMREMPQSCFKVACVLHGWSCVRYRAALGANTWFV